MTQPMPCLWSPFNWPTPCRFSYEYVSSICGVSADLIYFLDRGEYVDGSSEYLRERIARVNFTLKELAAGRRSTVIRQKLESRDRRALAALCKGRTVAGLAL